MISGSSAATLNGQLHICGGWSSNICEKYDVPTQLWVSAPPLDMIRRYPASILASPNELWITGGKNSNNQVVTSTITYDGTGSAPGPPLPVPVFAHCLVRVDDNRILLASGGDGGGNVQASAFIIDWSTKQWTNLPHMALGRVYHGCGKAGNKIVVAGGYSGGIIDSTEIFSLGSNSWSAGPKLPSPMTELDRAVLPLDEESTFALVGGRRQSGRVKSVCKYDPVSNGWVDLGEVLAVERGSMPVVRVPDDWVC